MVCRHTVAKYCQHTRVLNIFNRCRTGLHTVKIRRFADVGGVGFPIVGPAGWKPKILPVGIAFAHRRVPFAEHTWIDRIS